MLHPCPAECQRDIVTVISDKVPGSMMYRIIIFLATVALASAQLTAQKNVAPELRECYSNVTLINRNNLPPTSIQVLIDLIQNIEDNPSVNVGLREMAVLLLHT
ncbi:hypothetical protein EVAR_88313_1 [Eumeta japonica]|uniref:Uncharacterized protein n=1 Tax=Eumeta variegata TaxID=151549 RepID=A0A4C1VME8_EUMVA|nr:hypothetical protein EVAR_88313_1 [Eumeta japonica]